MADTYNVVRGDGVFFEGMTKEQIIAAIAEATGKTVEDIDSAFITKIKEINKGNAIRLWMGTNAEYNALETKEDDVLYYVTDDTFVEDTGTALETINNRITQNNTELTKKIDELIEKVNTMDTSLNGLLDKIFLQGYDGSLYTSVDTSQTNIIIGADLNVGEMKLYGGTAVCNSAKHIDVSDFGEYLVFGSYQECDIGGEIGPNSQKNLNPTYASTGHILDLERGRQYNFYLYVLRFS